MSHHWDAERERRHKQAGGVRACFRLSLEAEDALQLLCHTHRLNRLQVVERLLIAAAADPGHLRTDDQRIKALVREFNVSPEAAADAIARGLA